MSQASVAPSSFSVTCPGCGQRLRFSVGVEVPARVRIQCSACQTTFGVRRPGAPSVPGAPGVAGVAGTETPGSSLAGPEPMPATPPPLLLGIPVTMSPTSPGASVAPPRSPAASAASPASPRGEGSTGSSVLTAGSGSRPPRRRFDEPAFSPGEVIAGRYEVVRFIARGGMGEVYEVEDRELRERVALKTVRSEVARDTLTIERFRREIQLARKVTHPNVCRIFDVAHHRLDDAGDAGGTLIFLTMELLPGETLAEKIRREGKIPTETALPIVRQVTAALQAAHEAGVIHRDLKPGNVILVEGRGARSRAVVTDFGLARLESSAESGQPALTMTSAGVIGTPAYLAPEQVEGAEVTPAVDIYSLGIVLYEMLTGTVPFVGETALMTAVKRLREAPPSPRIHAPGLDPRWEGVVLRCLEREPAARFPTAVAVADALEGSLLTGSAETSLLTPLAPATPAAALPTREAAKPARPAASGAWSRQRLQVLGLAAVILLSAAVAFYRLDQWREEQAAVAGQLLPATADVQLRPSVAVLGFQDLSRTPGMEWLSSGLAEMLATELGAGGGLRIVPGENVARAKLELGLSQAPAQALAPDTLARVRRSLGADTIVLGSYAVIGGVGGVGGVGGAAGGAGGGTGRQIRLDLRIQDAAAGDTRTVAESGPESQLFELVSRAGGRLRQELGVGAGDGAARPGAPQAVRAALPASPQAARFYAEGLQRLRQFDPAGARDRLQQAVRADPNHALARSALATALGVLGYDAQARQQAKAALDLAAALPPEERLLIEGQYRETVQQWDQAAQTYWKLWSLYPDDLDHGLRLAAAQTSAGQVEEALATVGALRTLPEPLRDDPRIDLAEAMAAGVLSDFRRQQAAAGRAAARAVAREAPLMAAQARLLECRALRNLGQADKALAACEEGRRLHAERGDRAGTAEALTHAANVLFDQGNLNAAQTRYEEALSIYRALESKGGEAGALNNLAVVLKSQGNLDQARALYEQVIALTREIGSRGGEAYALNNLAGVLLRRGALDEAGRLFEESLAIRRETGDRSGEAYALDNLGVALRRRGDLTGARRRHEEALRIRRDVGQKIGEVASLNNLGHVLLDQGELGAARASFQEALQIGRQTGNASATANALFGLGEALAREGNVAESRRHHEEAFQMRTRLGERGAAAESRLALAGLALEAGEKPRAADLARAAAEELGLQGAPGHQALALVHLARAGNPAQARPFVKQARELLEGNQDLLARLAVDLRTASSLKPAEAEAQLRGVMDQANKAGLIELRLEASLALAAAETAGGKAAEGRARRAAAEQEAKSRGYAVRFLSPG